MSDVKLIAMIFAERVIVEQETHKHTIIGAFDRFYAESFPAVFMPWTIYVGVTNLEGDHAFTMIVQDAAGKPIVTVNGGFKAADRLDVVQLVVPVTGVVFPGEGTFTFILQVDGDPVCNRPLRVNAVKGGTPV